MRKPAILAFLSLYLCATTCLGEFLKAPVLLAHFIEHRSENNSITFLTFIYQHYQADDGNDQDNDRDSQLPFKSADSTSAQASAGFPVILNSIGFTPFSKTSAAGKALYQELNIPSSHLSRIWQPPKNS